MKKRNKRKQKQAQRSRPEPASVLTPAEAVTEAAPAVPAEPAQQPVAAEAEIAGEAAPEEEPVQAPAEASEADEPAEEPAEAPEEVEPAIEPVEAPEEVEPAEEPAEAPEENEPAEEPAEAPEEAEPAVEPVEAPEEVEPAVEPVEAPEEIEPAEEPAEAPEEAEPAVEPAEAPEEAEPAVEPAEASEENEPAVEPAEAPEEDEPAVEPAEASEENEPAVEPVEAPEEAEEEPTRAFPAISSPEEDEDVQVFGEEEASLSSDATRAIPTPEDAGDTIRLEQSDPALADTRPLDEGTLHKLAEGWAMADTTQEFPPVTEEAPDAEKAEPFSEDWEPEYDAPIGEYVPPQPIVFQPRSRIQELKQKLVAGPEHRYYELMEQGLSGLQAAIFLSALVVLLACGSLIVYALDLVPPERMRLMVFGQVLSMLLATLLASYQLMGGLASLFKGHVTPDTVLFFTLVACCADSLVCLNTLRVPYCAAYCLEVFLSLMSEYHRRNTEMGQMDTLRKAVCLSSVVKVDDYYDGRPGFLRTEGQLEDFMDNYRKPSAPEKMLSRYMIIIMIVSAVFALLAAIFRGWAIGLQVLAACLLAAMPATCFISLSRPAAVLERKLHRVGAVLCGWDAAKALSEGAAVPLTDQDLFPLGTLKMNGMKFFSDRDPDDTIACAAALVSAGGGGLGALFTKVLDSRNGRHYELTEFRVYPGGGLGGIVNGEPILVGSHSFVSDKGVEIPEGTRVNQALYAAIDGELCGVFAVSYQKCRASSAGLNSLTSYRNLTPVLTCQDFMLTEAFIGAKFGLNTKKIVFPDQEVRSALASRQPSPEMPGLALFTKPDLTAFAYTITGARALRSASTLGVVLHIFAGSLGLAIVAILALIGSIGLLAPDHLMLFELLWMIPAFLLTEWTRNV